LDNGQQPINANIDVPTTTPFPLPGDIPATTGGSGVVIVVIVIWALRVLMKDFPSFAYDMAKVFKYVQRPSR
jgi:hypothetical protein